MSHWGAISRSNAGTTPSPSSPTSTPAPFWTPPVSLHPIESHAAPVRPACQRYAHPEPWLRERCISATLHRRHTEGWRIAPWRWRMQRQQRGHGLSVLLLSVFLFIAHRYPICRFLLASSHFDDSVRLGFACTLSFSYFVAL
jgi:hypothetical protein